MSDTKPPLPSGLAARELGCSVTWLHELVARGELLADRDASGRLLISPAEVARLIAKRDAHRGRVNEAPSPGSKRSQRAARKVNGPVRR